MYILIIAAALWQSVITGIFTDTFPAQMQAAINDELPYVCVPNPEYKIQLIVVDDASQTIDGHAQGFTDDVVYRMVAGANADLRDSSDMPFVYQQFNFANTDCKLDIIRVDVSEIQNYTTSTDIADIILTQFHWSDPKTKYVILDPYLNFNCGLGQLMFDDRPGPENKNNRTSWAEMQCSAGWILGHEIFHMLGAVNNSAPHTNGQGHCWDGRDIMCYTQGNVIEQAVCPTYGLYDCNHDDYYSLAPPPGSYLATHWNVASSKYLTKFNGILLPLIYKDARIKSDNA